jgi:hypothetical protein
MVLTSSERLARPLSAGLALLLAALACARPDRTPARDDSASAAGASVAAKPLGSAPVTFTVVGQVAASTLDESSGLAASADAPGLFWTMNDDTEPVLFALDTTGADLGRVRLAGARNLDWETISIGPCEGSTCIYAGDTGDNEAVRRTRLVYRAPEPRRRGARFPASVPATRLEYRYADGPKDVEAMWVGADESIWLVSKRPARDSGTGRHRPALVYRIGKEAWQEKGVVVAQLVDSLPIIPGSAPGRLITDASLAPDRRLLALRTYTELYLLDVDAATGRPSAGTPRRVCDLTPVQERQGEGVAWLGASGDFLLSSEGSDVPKAVSGLARVRCAVP